MNYSRSNVMSRGHQIAKKHRDEFNTYKEALRYGLKAAWAEAKSDTLKGNFENKSSMVNVDLRREVDEEFAQRCMGIVEQKAVA